jgi:hypothetical protein
VGSQQQGYATCGESVITGLGPGYQVTSVNVVPQVVDLSSLDHIVESMPGFVLTTPLDLTGATDVVRVWRWCCERRWPR